MAAFIPDASVAIPWCARDEASAWTDRLLERLKTGDSALVPPLWPYEVTNTLLHLQRRGRITGDEVVRFLDDLRALPIQIDSDGLQRTFDRVVNLAERHRMTTYDAAYLELAVRTGHPLATKDVDLEAAAQAEGVILINKV